MANTPPIGTRETGRPLADVLEDLELRYDAVDGLASRLTQRYQRGEWNDPWWNIDRQRFDQRVLRTRPEIAGDYPYGLPDEVEEAVGEIEYRRLEFYSNIGWDRETHQSARRFLQKYPQSPRIEEVSQRFLLREASGPIEAFWKTALLEAGETPWLLQFLGGAVGCFTYFVRHGSNPASLRLGNGWLLAATALGALAATIPYALRPGSPSRVRWTSKLGLSPGRAWRAAAERNLYGETGDIWHAALRVTFTVGLASLAVGIFSRQVALITSLAFKAPLRVLRHRRFEDGVHVTGPLREMKVFSRPLDRLMQATSIHLSVIRDTGRQMTRSVSRFATTCHTREPWQAVGRWFWVDHPNQGARYALRTLRVGGGVGTALSVADVPLNERIKDSEIYPFFRVVAGAFMLVAVVEFTCTAMGLLRFGAYMNALAEIGIDIASQLRTTKLEEISFFRLCVPVIRTGIYKKALDVGYNITAVRRWRMRELVHSPTPAPTPASVSGRWLAEDLRETLFERVKRELFGVRFWHALEASIPTTVLMVIPYTLEGLLAQVNGWNYAFARTEQLIMLAPLMQLISSAFGNFTDWRSIIFNKFILFWTLGQASYNLHPRYGGEDRGIQSLVRELRQVEAVSDRERAERRDQVLRRHLVKKFGHIEGGLFSHGGIGGYEQMAGYLRACGYTLTSDDQPLGSLLQRLTRAAIGGDSNAYWDTLFTPDLKSYQTFFDTLRNPRAHGISPEEVSFLAETIEAYLARNPPSLQRPIPQDVKEWENWTLLRALTIMITIAGDHSNFASLKRHPAIAALRVEAYRYLAGTARETTEAKLAIALRRLTRETVRNYEGRKTYPPIANIEREL